MRILARFLVAFVVGQALSLRAQEVWTNQTPDILVGLYGNGTFVAAGEVIKISPDGRIWKTLQEGPFAFIRTGAFGNGRFVLSTGALLASSTNGVQWSYSTDFRASLIIFLDGRFWAVGAPNGDSGPSGIFSSTDGLNWNLAFRTTEPIVSVTSVNRGFFAVASTNDMSRLFTSGDGATWSESPPVAHHVISVGALRGIYFASTRDADGTREHFSSTNLINWNVMTLPSTNSNYMIDFVGNQFRLTLGGEIYSSTDALNWALEAKFDVEGFGLALNRPEGSYLFGTRGWIVFSPKVGEWEVISPQPQFYPENLLRVAFQEPNFYAAGPTGIVSSLDGARWTTSLTNAGPISAFSKLDTNIFAFGPGTGFKLSNGAWAAMGMNPKFSPIEATAGNGKLAAVAPHAIFMSNDGANWSLTFTNANLHVTDIAFGNGHFVSLGTNPENPNGVVSTNGIDWMPISVGIPNVALIGLVFGNGIFLAAQHVHDTNSIPADYSDLYASTDGSNWTRVTGSPPQPVGRLCFANGLFFLLAYDSVAFSPDGVNWQINQSNYEDRTGKVLFDIAYGGLRYVAVGGMVVTSYRQLSLDFLTNSNLELNLEPGSATGVVIEESTDFVNWRPVTAAGGDISSGYDITTGRIVRRFFRAKQTP